VLSLSLDQQFAAPPSEDRVSIGDTLTRHRQYAERLDGLHVLVRSHAGAALRCPNDRLELGPRLWSYPFAVSQRWRYPAVAYRLGKELLRTTPIDVITAQDPFLTGLVGWLLARRHGLPFNLQIHFDILDNPYWLLERPVNLALHVLAHWLVRRADTVRVGTTREHRKLCGYGLAPERVTVAPVPVDLTRFVSPNGRLLRDALLAGRFTRLVLWVARLVPQKDGKTLLKAAARVVKERPQTRFVLVGQGPQEQALRAYAEKLRLGDHVHFAGAVEHQAVVAYFSACDVLALSSLYEGTGLVLLEAAAAQRPAVATDVAGAEDVIQEALSGFIVPIRSDAALADRLNVVLDSSRLARTMGRRAHDHVRERFRPEALLERLIDLWTRTAMQGGWAPAGG
jgi:glycosyltransferase involved in cell wall biosynthesis